MTTIATLTGALILAVVTIYMAEKWLRGWYKRARKYEVAAENFFNCAHGLVKHKDTPEEIINIITALNSLILERKAAKLLLRWFFYCRKNNSKDRPVPPEAVKAFFAEHPKLEKKFDEAVGSAFLAMLYYGRGFFAVLARLMLEQPLRRHFLNETAFATIIAKRYENHKRKDPPASLGGGGAKVAAAGI